MSALDTVLATIDADRGATLDGLKEFLRIPSVSAKPEHIPDMRRCADWLAGQLMQRGLQVRIMPTRGYPVVVAQNQHIAGRPTVLYYGHYDVQPPEPLDLWKSPPFDPTVRDENGHPAIYARGAVDDKGQVWAHVQAIHAWQQAGGLPVNLTMLIEGEEEVGSENLFAFLREHRAEFKADIALISDTNQVGRGQPAITYGMRGLVYQEVFLTGPDHDLHSGGYGGSVPNPANVLCELLATLHDGDGRVNIPGFYDGVQIPAVEPMAELPFDEKAAAAELGLPFLSGEKSFSTTQRRTSRPTCDINGLTSGYQGQGAKTVIPSKASAKVSMRLVPNQDPGRIEASFRQALRDRCPKNVKIEFEGHGLAYPSLVPIDSKPMRLAAEAVQRGFGVNAAYIRSGGTIPVVAEFKSTLNVESLLVGFGLPDDRVHSPNEKFDLAALHAGTRTAAALYERLAEL